MKHLMPSKTQKTKEANALINDLSTMIEKANTEGKHWTIATLLRLKESVTADIKKMA